MPHHLSSLTHESGFRKKLLPCSSASFALIVGALFLTCLLFPYTGDDWAWGSSIGLERLHTWFKDYNGRYLGNLLVIVMTRSIVLRAAIMSLVIVGIAWCIHVIVGRDDSIIFWVAMALLLAMPSKIRAQGIAWTSGFTNYAVPALFLLWYLASIHCVFEEDYHSPACGVPPMFILGLCNTLIMENVTIVSVCSSLVILIYTRLRHGVWDRCQIAFVIGALLGSALMFSNGAYYKISQNDDGYRDVDDTIDSASILSKYFVTVAPMLALNNFFVNAGIATCSWLSFRNRKTLLSGISSIVLILLCAYSSIALNGWISYPQDERVSLFILGGGILVILSLLAAVIAAYDPGRPLLSFAVTLYIVTLTVPLLIVSPIGPRNFLISYAFYILIACLIMNKVLDTAIAESLRGIIPAVVSLGLLSWVAFYAVVARAEYQRHVNASHAIAEHEAAVVVPTLPHSNYIHTANPTSEPWISRYKLFYGLNEDIELIVE